MSAANSTLVKDIEELVKKAAEANMVFLNEGSKLMQQFGTTGKKQEIPSVKPELLMDAFNSMVKLNIQHASRMIDLGLSFTKKMRGMEEDVIDPVFVEEDKTTDFPQPAFILRTETNAGETAVVQFLLDNIKKEEVVCQLIQTDFVNQSDATIKTDFKTSFSPQAFPLQPSESKKVDISIQTNADAAPGIYLSDVQVLGFEPAFFSIYLTLK